MARDASLDLARQIKRELRDANAEVDRLGTRIASTGKQAGRQFGRSLKAAAMFGVKELAKGALQNLGSALAMRLMDRGKKGGKSFGKSFKRAAQTEISTVAAGMKFNLGAMSIVGAGVLAAGIAHQITSSMQSAIEEERLNISFNALSTDGVGGGRIFEEIRKQALATGVEIKGMASSVQRFLGLGFAEADALELNRSLLDIAGALGMSTTEASLLGMALAQVKAKGVASMEELRQQIAEKGVPVFEVLAEKVGVTEAEIIKMVSSGKLGADVVIEAFQNLEGPLARFRGGADRLGSSAGGLFARIKQEVVDLRREFAAELLPELKPFLTDVIAAIRGMKDEAKAFGEKMAEVIGNTRAMFQALSLSEIFELAALKFKAGLLDAMNVVVRMGAALSASFADGSLSGAMERAALKFKETMLLSLSEITSAIAAAQPDTIIGRRVASRMNDVSGELMISGKKARSAGNNLPDSPDFLESFARAFRDAASNFGLSENESDRMGLLVGRIRAQRAQNLAEQSDDAPAPTPGTGGSGSQTAAPMGAGGIVAGGLANALSRIAGGPNTIIMQRQLDIATKTQKASERTASAVETLVKNQPRQPRGGQPQFT